ncbi:MAG: class I SAM-dependent methyltransferase [Chitinophagales bacterium]|nr:class I SAM-dependent methyltransferase [Chitinophagales bacterium]MDW8273845.1 class I SAM-dependent methyltransferase [Chitinophagales bacterium]
MMVPYISPKSQKVLLERGGQLETEDGSERFPVVKGIPRFVSGEQYTEGFGLQWNTYKKTQLDSYTGKPISEERLRRCLGFDLEKLKGLTVLEAGCGPGRFTELFVKNGALTHSFDLSLAVEANLENVGSHPHFKLAQADIYQIPYPDDSFDIVCCLGVIQHTPSPERTIEALWKKVKPGGLLVIDHYKWRWSYYSTLKPLYRKILLLLPPQKAKRVIDKLVDFFFPIQWAVRDIRWLHRFINRFTPLIVHYHSYPGFTRDEYKEWARMDTMDSTTDVYKHLRTPRQIESILQRLGGQNIWINEGGNGVEARATKPFS